MSRRFALWLGGILYEAGYALICWGHNWPTDTPSEDTE